MSSMLLEEELGHMVTFLVLILGIITKTNNLSVYLCVSWLEIFLDMVLLSVLWSE